MADRDSSLDCHLATPAEREAAYRNVSDVWSMGLSPEEHLRRRLTSPKHQSARWYVGCLDGQVVTSLGAYPLELRIHGHVLPSVAIGSVHTLPAFRGRGLAPRLLDWVHAFLQARGTRATLLYSDIEPEFYARLGYRRCPCYVGWVEASPRTAASSGPRHQAPLTRFDPTEEVARMAELYDAYHGRFAISIARSAQYWQQLLCRGENDEFYWLGTSREVRGYVRLACHEAELRISDFALTTSPASTDAAESLYRGIVELAGETGAARVGGWLPKTAAAQRCFRLEPRTQEIAMIKVLDEADRFDDDALRQTDHFTEIDHV